MGPQQFRRRGALTMLLHFLRLQECALDPLRPCRAAGRHLMTNMARAAYASLVTAGIKADFRVKSISESNCSVSTARGSMREEGRSQEARTPSSVP
jgi:hypothetical protein